ncbi:MAG: hypothetical protein AAFY76_08225 [Cyanobacteria bacterium J06649_11]
MKDKKETNTIKIEMPLHVVLQLVNSFVENGDLNKSTADLISLLSSSSGSALLISEKSNKLSEVTDLIKEIFQNDIKKALLEFKIRLREDSVLVNDVLLLINKCNRIETHFNEGIIGYELLTTETNKIGKSLLLLLDELDIEDII